MKEILCAVVRRWWLLPLLFVVVAGSVAVNLHESEVDRPWPVALAAAATLVLFAVDRWPWAVLLNGLLVGGYFAIGGESGPIFFTVMVATFLVALRRTVREWLPYVVGSGVLVWAGLLVRGIRTDQVDLGLWQAFGIGALVAAAAAIATTVRARGEARADRVRRAASEEKLRMAQDLHDGVGHGLAVVAMQAGVALHVLDRDPAAARASLEAIRDTSREALDALRAELSQLAGDPAPRGPRRGLDDLEPLVERVRAAGLAVDVAGDVAGDVQSKPSAPAELDEAAYAIVQEALTNVLRHAGATRVVIGMARAGDTLVLTVTDDGRGGPVQDEGMGISGMRDRATALGGSLTAGPGDAGGFEVRAVLPLAAR